MYNTSTLSKKKSIIVPYPSPLLLDLPGPDLKLLSDDDDDAPLIKSGQLPSPLDWMESRLLQHQAIQREKITSPVKAKELPEFNERSLLLVPQQKSKIMTSSSTVRDITHDKSLTHAANRLNVYYRISRELQRRSIPHCSSTKDRTSRNRRPEDRLE